MSMSAVEHRYWQGYIRTVADRIRLKDWDINLIPNQHPESDEAHAQVTIIYGRRVANIRLAASFPEDSREEQRHTVVHELVHCHVEPIACVMRRTTEGRTEGWLALAVSYHDEQIEQATDALASAFAPLLPLPLSRKAILLR